MFYFKESFIPGASSKRKNFIGKVNSTPVSQISNNDFILNPRGTRCYKLCHTYKEKNQKNKERKLFLRMLMENDKNGTFSAARLKGVA